MLAPMNTVLARVLLLEHMVSPERTSEQYLTSLWPTTENLLEVVKLNRYLLRKGPTSEVDLFSGSRSISFSTRRVGHGGDAVLEYSRGVTEH